MRGAYGEKVGACLRECHEHFSEDVGTIFLCLHEYSFEHFECDAIYLHPFWIAVSPLVVPAALKSISP